MEQLVPVANLSEDYIEGQDPASLARRFAIVMAARAVANPGAMLLDFQIAGGAGGTNYRVGMPSSPVANPGSILCSRAQVVFGFAQAAAALNTRVANLLAALLAAHPAAVVRFIQFGSANGDGEHLIGIVWEDGAGPDGFLGLRTTRIWEVPLFPATDVEIHSGGALTLIKSVPIPLTSSQLGRAYLVSYELMFQGLVGTEFFTLLTSRLQVVCNGAPAASVYAALPNSMVATAAAATEQGLCVRYAPVWPGVNCPPFALPGANAIEVWVANSAAASVFAIQVQSSMRIVEVAGDLTNLLQIVAP